MRPPQHWYFPQLHCNMRKDHCKALSEGEIGLGGDVVNTYAGGQRMGRFHGCLHDGDVVIA